MLCCCCCCCCCCCQTYLNDYLHQEKGFSVQLSTVVILVFGLGGAVGVVAGGAGGQLLYNW
jgi:predicted MFS family arabinose efflux permease